MSAHHMSRIASVSVFIQEGIRTVLRERHIEIFAVIGTPYGNITAEIAERIFLGSFEKEAPLS